MTTPHPIPAYWLEERTPVLIPEGVELEPQYELADQDGFLGGTAYLTKKGKLVAVETENL